jgi:heat shock protein HtpX
VFVLLALAAAFLGYLLAIVIRLALSRRREFVADMGSVELTKNPDAMISALMKISGGAEKLNAPESVRAMFLDDHESGIYALFATHPPIPDRIDALVRYAGGKLPQVQPEPAVTEGPWGGARKGPWG